MRDILFDAQTSGGLLICLEQGKAETLLGRLHDEGIVEAAIVGEAVAGDKGRISVR